MLSRSLCLIQIIHFLAPENDDVEKHVFPETYVLRIKILMVLLDHLFHSIGGIRKVIVKQFVLLTSVVLFRLIDLDELNDV